MWEGWERRSLNVSVAVVVVVCFLFRQLWIFRYIKYVSHTQACLNFFIHFDLMPFLLQNRFLCSNKKELASKEGLSQFGTDMGNSCFAVTAY